MTFRSFGQSWGGQRHFVRDIQMLDDTQDRDKKLKRPHSLPAVQSRSFVRPPRFDVQHHRPHR